MLRIVSVEAKGPHLQIFQQQAGGAVVSAMVPHRYWFLSHEQKSQLAQGRLKGDGHFKFLKCNSDRRMFLDEIRTHEKPFAVWDSKEAAILISGANYYQNLDIAEIGALSFDLETNSIQKDADSRILLISNTFRQGDRIERKLFAYDDYATQGEMLTAWCRWVNAVNPSILLGHNIIGFDLPYLQHVAELKKVRLPLGRDGSELEFENFTRQFRKDGSQSYTYNNPRVMGREVIDTLFLAIKSDTARRYEGYGLKQIVRQEGLERAERQHYDASAIHKLYRVPAEWAKIKVYAQHDADDALALFDLMAAPFFYMARSIPRSFQSIVNTASGSQINAYLVGEYLRAGHSIPKASDPIQFAGAISLGNPGRYLHVAKFDVSSLYPNIIRHWKIYNAQKDPHGHFLKMIERFTMERLENKRLHRETGESKYKALSDAQKIIINSCYGFLGAPGLNFNSPEHAALVTEKGREILTQAMDWCRDKGFQLVNADTDSIAFCKADQSPIDATERAGLLADLNAQYPELIRFEDDGYYDAALVIKAKNYVLRHGNRLTIKGSALKATGKEPALRECIHRMVKALLEDQTPHITSIEQEYIQEIENLTDIHRWAAKRTVTAKVLAHGRSYEAKVFEALKGSDYGEGDKVFVYFTESGTLRLAEHWAHDHCKVRLLKKLKQTISIVRGKKAS